MYNVPFGVPVDVPFSFGPIVDPASFAVVAFTNLGSELSLGFATWLAMAGLVYLALLPLAFRTRTPKRVVHPIGSVELRKAA